MHRLVASTWRAGSRIQSRAASPNPPPITNTSGSKACASVTRPCPSASPTLRSRATASASPCAAHSRTSRASAGSPWAARASDPRGCAAAQASAISVTAVPEQYASRWPWPGQERAGRPVAVDHDVAELRAGAGRAPERAIVDHHAAADAGAEGQRQRVVAAGRGPVPVLGHRRAVRVVLDHDVHPGLAAQHLARRRLGHRQVRGLHDDAPALLDRAREADPDAVEVVVAGRSGTSAAICERIARPGALFGRDVAARGDGPVRADAAREDLRPAHIDADGVEHGGKGTWSAAPAHGLMG